MRNNSSHANLIDRTRSFGTVLLIFYIISSLCFQGCVEPIHPYSAVAPGIWRGVIFINPNESVRPDFLDQKGDKIDLTERNSTGVLPFLFEVIYQNDTTWNVEIINGAERIAVNNITFERTKSSADKTLILDFVEYDSHIEAIVKEDIMQGHFVVRSKKNYRIPFAAYHGEVNRFLIAPNKVESTNFDGKWEVTFEPGTEDEYPAIAEFSQEGNKVTGTFLTETGDYRYLAGIAEENKLWLSVFDGAHAFLFHAKDMGDGTLQGTFKSGKHYTASWVAKRNEDVTLTHPDSLSVATMEEFSISFPDENGKLVTFPNPASQDKIKILQIMGTWCPNCKDETQFLTDYVNGHPEIPLDVAAIAFERYDEQQQALDAIKRYRNKLNIPYPILYGGAASKSAASEKLPMIDKVISYPTMIFLDKSNRVRKVHTGFSGPATSKFETYEKEFHQWILQLAAE